MIMANEINTRLNGDTKHRFVDYLEDRDDTSQYEAARELIDEGLRRQGYHPQEDKPASRLRDFFGRLAFGLAIAGLILTGMSFTGNPGVQVFTVAVFATAIVLEATNRLAATHIDDLSARIRGAVTDE